LANWRPNACTHLIEDLNQIHMKVIGKQII